MAPLRCTCAQGILTWSRVAAADNEECARLFQAAAVDAVLALFPDAKYTAGVERHSDGVFHLHIGFCKEDNIQKTIHKRFDVMGIHPNLKPHSKSYESREAALRYPLKEDDMAEVNWTEEEADDIFNFFSTSSSSRVFPGDRAAADEGFAAALACESYDDAMAALRAANPRDFVLHHNQLESFFKKYFTPVLPKKYTLDQFNVPPLDFSALSPRESYVLYGLPNIGKTFFAMAHGDNAFMVNDIDKLRQFNPSLHDVVVFDEISFSHWPPTAVKNIFDAEVDRDIRCRWATVNIPAVTKKIFVCNDLSELLPKDMDALPATVQDAIKSRMKCVYYDTPLFDTPAPATEMSDVEEILNDIINWEG